MEASPDSGPTSVTKSQTVEKGEVGSIKLRYLSVRANDLSGSEKEPQVKGRPPTSGLCQHKIPGNTTGGKLGCLSVSYSKEVYNKTFMNSNTHGVTDWQPEQKQALARGVSHTCKCSNTRSMRWGGSWGHILILLPARSPYTVCLQAHLSLVYLRTQAMWLNLLCGAAVRAQPALYRFIKLLRVGDYDEATVKSEVAQQ